ncbi:uncharacterized protein LOC129586340 [Paramacrobiotus metropolitanus]|uniref:uncharacterized protein LOC129586340 n=1 Tax=Paramacrobiotus metropolitanus TaxID=2943436 RepID=UPI0024459EEC|nr:uncharacterized protein LOC129586340 [Paramacrobiotus metropolitanus]
MSVGLGLIPGIEKEVEELEKICSPQGIRRGTPLNRDDMVEKLTTAEALNQVATAQEVVMTAWKDVEANVQMKRNRLRTLIVHWQAMLRTIDELRKQQNEKTVRYVIGHQMQSRAAVVPDGKVVLDIGANVYVDFSYDEADERLQKALSLGKTCSDRLTNCLEECKRNIVISEVNLSQLHNYSVEIRDTLLKRAG